MSNSSRIEAATRQHVGAILTSEQIVELVKVADPNWKGGVYPSDAAYTRTSEGLLPRGKVAYGDGVPEYLGANSFKVLPTTEIVRRPTTRKAAPAPEPAKVETAKPAPAKKEAAGKKEAAKAGQSKPPVVAKQKAAERRASV